MNKNQILELAKELMPHFSTIIIDEDFDAEQEDSWKISVGDSGFYNDKLEIVMVFAKKHNLCFVIRGNALEFFEDDGASDGNKETEVK